MKKQISIPVSPGELLDKITILEIKSEQIVDPDKLENVHLELELLEQVWSEADPDEPEVEELRGLLAQINRELWEIEDDIRDCEARKDFGETFVALARAVYRTNDRRSEVKMAINRKLGSEIIEEKSYSQYEN